MIKRPAALAALGLVMASGLAWWWPRSGAQPMTAAAASKPDAAGGATAAVEVVRVRVQRIEDAVQAVGSVQSRQSIMLRPEVSGRIKAFGFKDGARVKRGQLLVQLDDDVPRAQLRQAQAQAAIARTSHARNRELLDQGFVSRSAVDQSDANLAVAQAQVATAQAQLSRLRIVAPFDGQVGIRKVSLGDYVKDGTDLVTLEDTGHLMVDFRVPERFTSRLRMGQPLRLSLDALPGTELSARVVATEPLVDADGRALGVRAEVLEAPAALRPGMFARVRLVLDARAQALTVPEEAVAAQGTTQYVYRMADAAAGASGALQAQRVKVLTGARGPGWVEVREGLADGDRVVTAGQAKLRGDTAAVRVLEPVAAGASGSASH